MNFWERGQTGIGLVVCEDGRVAEHIPEMPSDEEKGKEPTKAPYVLPWNVRHKGVRYARDKVDGYILLFRHVYIYLSGDMYGFVILK